jgi:hypothetical protein
MTMIDGNVLFGGAEAQMHHNQVFARNILQWRRKQDRG